MPLYSNSAFGAPFKTIKRADTVTEPNYLFGEFDFHTQPFKFQVTQVALAGNVATYTVQIAGGGGPNPNFLPKVGAKMGVRGTTAASGAFNVDPAIVTGVTLTGAGTGTITCALTHANVTGVADKGELIVQPYENPDLVVAGSASRPIALIFSPDESDNSRSFYADATWTGTLPTAATVVMQVANVDDDSQYATIRNTQGTSPTASVDPSDALATVAAGAVTQSGAEYSFIMGKFIRAKVLSMTGGDATTGLIVRVFI